jgi:CBS domain-containing protein
MPRTASDAMTPDPACYTANTTLDQVAKMMARSPYSTSMIHRLARARGVPKISGANPVDGR